MSFTWVSLLAIQCAQSVRERGAVKNTKQADSRAASLKLTPTSRARVDTLLYGGHKFVVSYLGTFVWYIVHFRGNDRFSAVNDDDRSSV